MIVVVAVLVVGGVAGCVFITRSAHAKIGEPPSYLSATSLTFPSGSGETIQTWYVQGRKGCGAVLLLHGVYANRLAHIARAKFLSASGYAVLLIDFQAHGESTGDHVTFGFKESRDAAAALAKLRELAPGEKVGIVGTSLGGAATLLAEPPLEPDALVLEQVYPTVMQAFDNRMRLYLGPLGHALVPPLAVVLGKYLDISAEQMRPIDRIAANHSPKLIIGGDADTRTPLVETRALFDAASEPKELWIVPGADHVDLARFAGAEYERRVLAFLGAHLRRDAVGNVDGASGSGIAP